MLIRVYYRRENARKAAVRWNIDYQKITISESLDLTDKENPEVVYTIRNRSIVEM